MKLELRFGDKRYLEDIADGISCEKRGYVDTCWGCPLNIFDNEKISCKDNAKMLLEVIKNGNF